MKLITSGYNDKICSNPYISYFTCKKEWMTTYLENGGSLDLNDINSKMVCTEGGEKRDTDCLPFEHYFPNL